MIVGITGKAGSGKDTVADILVREHGFVKVSLADPMKRFCREVFDFSVEQLWGPSEKRSEIDPRYPAQSWMDEYEFHGVSHKGLTPRLALQWLGTEWGRACYENVWIDYALRIAEGVLKNRVYSPVQGLTDTPHAWPRTGVVIPDVRFRNELDAIHKAGGKVLRVYRESVGTPEREGWRQHASETESDGFGVEDFDSHILNDGPLEALPGEVQRCLWTIGFKR